MKTKNVSERGVRVGRYYIPPKVVLEIPEDLLYKPRQQRLRDDGVLSFPHEEKKAEEKPAEAPAEEEETHAVLEVSTDVVVADVLTALVHIGKARESTLSDNDITSFQHLVDLGAEELSEMLDVDRPQAEEIVEGAKAKLDG